MLDLTSWLKILSSRPLFWRRGGGIRLSASVVLIGRPPSACCREWRQTWRSWAPWESRSLTPNASWTSGWGRSEPAAAHTLIFCSRGGFRTNFLSRFFSCVSGKVGVPGEVEGMVIQVSASGAETMKTTTAARLLVRVEPPAQCLRSFFIQMADSEPRTRTLRLIFLIYLRFYSSSFVHNSSFLLVEFREFKEKNPQTYFPVFLFSVLIHFCWFALKRVYC